MKKLVREYEFSPEQLNTVRALARRLGVTETTASILFARGMDTEERMREFLNPSREHFLSPFLMRGMREAVDLITQARDGEWNVAVFGDYDADGIGALAVLSRALKRFGIEPYLYVPERADGYGMNVAAVDKIFDEFLPDLIITVDCGISNKKEVEYIKELGAYCIVTDHHELPDELPDCIVVNPKLKDDYPYDNLCGAGVAFKLAQALIGEDALDLVDFCALSTVADSVPLLGENRDIVAEGLKRIEASPRPCFAALLGENREVTAQTLAFTIAPRINAAGRMGDALTALKLFTTEDEGEIFELAAQLNAYNLERQKCCDDLYNQALRMIDEEGAYGNVIMLSAQDWNAGFVGIVAARLAEEFARPALLFVQNGDALKGSARSIETVNVFEALKACSEWIEEFGGHAQAAGINVKAENFDALKRALNEYIGSRYTREDFVPVLSVCGEGDVADRRLAREICSLEPFGVGNRRPLFTMEAGALDARPLKVGSPHLSITGGPMDFMYFGGIADLSLLRSEIKKTLVFEYNLSHFRGKEQLKGFVRTLNYEADADMVALESFENTVRGLIFDGVEAELSTTDALNSFILEKRTNCPYGLCCVYSDPATLAAFPAVEGLPTDIFRPSEGSTVNTLLFAPEADCKLSGYREIVYLDRPARAAIKKGKARVIVNAEICGYRRLRDLSFTREELLGVFAEMRGNEARIFGDNYSEAARSCNSLGFSEELFVFALAVFEELGLVKLADGRFRLFRGKHTSLTDSRIFCAAQKLKEE